ncbi:hypothetical protein [Nostoc sp.]
MRTFPQTQPNVALMDLRMPKMEGADAIALIIRSGDYLDIGRESLQM